MRYKKPHTVLVVIYDEQTNHVLLLQRNDDATFWQSVTGSLEQGETPAMAAAREVHEEIGVDIVAEHLTIVDCQKCVAFDIFPQFRHRYAPNVKTGTEHWFLLALPCTITPKLTEHTAFQWLPPKQAAALTKSWNNAAAILEFIPE